MGKKLTGKALAKLEAERDVWKEALEGVKEIKAGGGRRIEALPNWASDVVIKIEEESQSEDPS